MSDIDIHIGPLGWRLVALILGAPGMLMGAAGGAAIARRRRLASAALGALAGGALWLAGRVALGGV